MGQGDAAREFIIVTASSGAVSRHFVAQGDGDKYVIVGNQDGYMWPTDAEEARKDEEALARVIDRDLLSRLPAYRLRWALGEQSGTQEGGG